MFKLSDRTNKIILRYHKRGQAKLVMEPLKMCGGNAISYKYVFLTKGGCSLKRFNCNRELIQIVGVTTKKALSLVLGTKCCLETDDLRVIEIPEKCSRLTKYVGC